MKPTFKINGRDCASRRRRCSREDRARYLKLFGRSGLSVPAFCREHGLVPVTFYNWRRATGALPQADAGFAEIAVAPSTTAADGSLCIHVGELMIEAKAGTDAAWIARVLAALRSAQ